MVWNPRKVLFLPPHLKMVLMVQFVRPLDKESPAFKLGTPYLNFFPKLSAPKLEAGVLIGSPIKKRHGVQEVSPPKLTK